ncbi:Alternative NAD(P)H dehydrogenase 2, mitochondrial [Apostasia shenzhenica]|uniref:Alternative NAD(P)H dehydrogenase 2, mitochondrial n=1 Tax=Apostasia shenzhenica TaxID=1088818 RepID=A0A2I0AXK2_9ASPA|nr:Alternative NAD(P)H dehydrogenase 2, mitochondrial [Apostasia shenzhenica]
MAFLRTVARLSRSSITTASFRQPHIAFTTATASPSVVNAAVPPDISHGFAGLGPTVPGKEKPRVVVLGSGWAGCRLMKSIDTNTYDVVCISPRNHMVFTPLLASTCVGTLEFRSVAEPIGRIQPAISHAPGSYFFLARCSELDPESHSVSICFSYVIWEKCDEKLMKGLDLWHSWCEGTCDLSPGSASCSRDSSKAAIESNAF